MAAHNLVIVHVDDELHLVEQMPDQIRLQFNLLHPHLDTGELIDEEAADWAEGRAISAFTVKWPDGTAFRIEYQLLAEMPNPEWGEVVLAIFDYLTMNNSEMQPLSTDKVREIVRSLGADNVFVFTGYPDPAMDLKDIVADGNFIVKPGDSVAMTAQLVARLVVAMNRIRNCE